MRMLLILPVLVASFALEELVRPHAENHPWAIAIALLVVGGTVAGVVFLLSSGPMLGVVAFLVGGVGWGLIAGWDARDNYLTPYCEYGARSQAQLDGCLGKVNSEDIDALDTPAARYARGETAACGAGAGPYCEG